MVAAGSGRQAGTNTRAHAHTRTEKHARDQQLHLNKSLILRRPGLVFHDACFRVPDHSAFVHVQVGLFPPLWSGLRSTWRIDGLGQSYERLPSQASHVEYFRAMLVLIALTTSRLIFDFWHLIALRCFVSPFDSFMQCKSLILPEKRQVMAFSHDRSRSQCILGRIQRAACTHANGAPKKKPFSLSYA